ncbi:hypothetical protein, partial [Bosea sp. TND4EK4]|uniref:hypothetical protein n=1 Tax=Bosea sp. TND4EK4 TaxID=1907408 RepID=UPI001AECB97B
MVEADARALIDQHGIQAYGVARWRAHQVGTGKLVDDSRPSGKRDPIAACGYAAAVWGGFSAHAHGSISSIF